MQMLDALAALLVIGAAAAVVFGARALARADDFQALYLLVIGGVALRAGVSIVRPGASA